MEALKTFTSQALGATVKVGSSEDGKLWIVASDVFNYLEIKYPYASMHSTPDSEKRKIPARVLNMVVPGKGWVTLISEQGMYGILMRSRKPKALAFRNWLSNDVLPQLRKDVAPPQLKDTVLDPDMLIKLATELKVQTENRRAMIDTLSVAKARATRLENLMGLGTGGDSPWLRAASIPWLDKYFKLAQPTYDAVEELLVSLSKSLGMDVANVPVNDTTTIKVFHKRSISLLRKMVEEDPKLLKRFRNGCKPNNS